MATPSWLPTAVRDGVVRIGLSGQARVALGGDHLNCRRDWLHRVDVAQLVAERVHAPVPFNPLLSSACPRSVFSRECGDHALPESVIGRAGSFVPSYGSMEDEPSVEAMMLFRRHLTALQRAVFLLIANTLAWQPVHAQTDITRPAAINSLSSSGAGRNIWLSAAEIQALPMTGPAWDHVRGAAYGAWSTPDLKAAQTATHACYCFAGALVYVRLGDPSLRAKVRDGILAAKRTLDEQAEYNVCPSTLYPGRQIIGYVVAADLIDLASYDPAADAEFVAWLKTIIWQDIPLSAGGYGRTVRKSSESASDDHANTCLASRLARSVYLDSLTDVARIDSLLRAKFDRAYFPANTFRGTEQGYFVRTTNWEATWACGDSLNWIAVNSPCLEEGKNLDGALVEDVSRGGPFAWPPLEIAMTYSWGGVRGLLTQMEILSRRGYGAYNYGNQGLKRTMDFMVRAGYQLNYTNFAWLPYLVNHRYGTTYPTPITVGLDYALSWTDWTHAR